MAVAEENLFDLSGRVALVTGGAQGLGAAIGSMLSRQRAVTVLVDIDLPAAEEQASKIEQQTGNLVQAVACDVGEEDQVAELVTRLAAEHGRLDVLVNNAGIHRRVDALAPQQEDVREIFRVNLLGALNMSSAVGGVMVGQGDGTIINISALGGGLVGLGRGGSAYGMSKGGIVALTRDLAAEWTGRGVRVNAVAPGWIRTPMTEALQNNEQGAAMVLKQVPAGRWGEPEDVAGVVTFLASDASRYISGHTIPVDGGALNVISIS
ncbi:MAG: SDR family NAD(P)-dependent oxidoreductase [Pirellulaceae bacterium]|jgi:gluconate 5-dehydrogenase|nr:SDR family NAD(P)-dependent oxidoreductase [Pirellulaceae bacterium]